jgi:hypothetical protein
VIVVNDGDEDRPWDLFDSISDPRLIRFDLLRNHGGPYFADAVVVNAAASTWFLIQEQDDWSEPDRITQLLQSAHERDADVAISAQLFHQEQPDGLTSPIGVRFSHCGAFDCPACGVGADCQRCFVDTGLTPQFRYRAPHAGLFSLDLLRSIGGYYAGLHIHFDSLLMNLILMVARLAHVPAPLYNRLLRPDSLTHQPETGFGSSLSNRERQTNAEIYDAAFAQYRRHVNNELSRQDLIRYIRNCCRSRVPYDEQEELEGEAERLRSLLRRNA